MIFILCGNITGVKLIILNKFFVGNVLGFCELYQVLANVALIGKDSKSILNSANLF